MASPPKKWGKIQKKTKNKENKDSELRKHSLVFVELIDDIRNATNEVEENAAFDKILKLMKEKIEKISYRFRIPGLSFNDVHQEALFALRYKAIKDYDPDRSSLEKVSPFDRFAMLCIRRHLSTKLKSSYQNKSRILNTSISIDQDRNKSSSVGEESLFLSDILFKGDIDIISGLKKRENFTDLMKKLYADLSYREKQVLLLYTQKCSYQEIRDKINKPKRKNKINIKSVDNALSRIKRKAKHIYKKHEK